MNYLKSTLLLIVILFTTHVYSQDVASKFDQLARDFEKATMASNAEKLGKLFTADAVFTDEYGDSYAGRKAIDKRWDNMFTKVKYKNLAIDISEIINLGNGMHMARGGYAVSVKVGDATMDMTGQYYIICKLEGNKLLIHRQISSRDDQPM